MTDSDNESGAISDASEQSEKVASPKVFEKDEISLADGEAEAAMESEEDDDGATPVSAKKQLSAEDLTAGAQAISSEDEDPKPSRKIRSRSPSDAEDGAYSSARSTPEKQKHSGSEEDGPPAKKQKSDSRDDLEEGELTSDSEEEGVADTSKNVFRRNDKMMMRNHNHPKVDFPRMKQMNGMPNARRRPEDFGICKFYLRGNCTWDRTCKYTHPTGAQKVLWLAECGISDPSIAGIKVAKPEIKRKSSRSRSRSPRPRDFKGTVFERRRTVSRRSNGSHVSPAAKESPKALPISSGSERSVSPKERRRERKSMSAVTVSSDEEEHPRRQRRKLPRTRNDESDNERRRARSTSSSSQSSRSRSHSPVGRKTQTTLGALLRKKRLESMQKHSSPESHAERDVPTPEPRQPTRGEAIRRLFTKNPDNEPEIYRKPRKSPTPECISSSEDALSDDNGSPRRQARSESPLSASAEV